MTNDFNKTENDSTNSRNEKRFIVKQRQGATIYSIEDYYGELPLHEGIYYKSNAEKLCKWLNTQQELLNAFCKENEHIKQTIKTMMENERTHLGKNVLRQLWEAIQ